MFSRKKVVFAAAIETTRGVAETIDATDAVFNVRDFELQNETTKEEVPGQGGFGRLASVPGPSRARATFRTDIRYNGTTIGNWASVLLPACGIVNSGGVYSPRAEGPGANVKTLTIARYCDGKRRLMYGASGPFQAFFPTGQLAYILWDFQGVWDDEIDTPMITPNYPNEETPLKVANGSASYGGVNFCAASCTFNLGNILEPIECITGKGFSHFVIADRNPKITTDPFSVFVVSQNRYGKFFAGDEEAFSLSIPATSSSASTMAAPKAEILTIQEGERGMMCIDNMELQCNKNVDANDQEFSISFT
jgi:hypothetical protein